MSISNSTNTVYYEILQATSTSVIVGEMWDLWTIFLHFFAWWCLVLFILAKNCCKDNAFIGKHYKRKNLAKVEMFCPKNVI